VTFKSWDEFEFQVTYHGRTLGGNQMFGFRILTGEENNEEEVGLIAEYDFVNVME
jgi:hypothetical protein